MVRAWGLETGKSEVMKGGPGSSLGKVRHEKAGPCTGPFIVWCWSSCCCAESGWGGLGPIYCCVWFHKAQTAALVMPGVAAEVLDVSLQQPGLSAH